MLHSCCRLLSIFVMTILSHAHHNKHSSVLIYIGYTMLMYAKKISREILAFSMPGWLPLNLSTVMYYSWCHRTLSGTAHAQSLHSMTYFHHNQRFWSIWLISPALILSHTQSVDSCGVPNAQVTPKAKCSLNQYSKWSDRKLGEVGGIRYPPHTPSNLVGSPITDTALIQSKHFANGSRIHGLPIGYCRSHTEKIGICSHIMWDHRKVRYYHNWVNWYAITDWARFSHADKILKYITNRSSLKLRAAHSVTLTDHI